VGGFLETYNDPRLPCGKGGKPFKKNGVKIELL